jgi:hypothetical protein
MEFFIIGTWQIWKEKQSHLQPGYPFLQVMEDWVFR